MRKILILILLLIPFVVSADEFTLVGELDGFVNGFRVEVSGNYAYVLDRMELVVIDVSDPTEPYEAGRATLPGYGLGIDVEADYAYITAGTDICAVDISDPTSPEVVATFPVMNYSYDLKVRDGWAYLANFSQILVLRLTTSTSFETRDTYSPSASVKSIDVAGGVAYVGAETNGFYTVDISDTLLLRPLGHTDTPGWCQGIEVQGDYAYIADAAVVGVPDTASVQIVDISDPTSPGIVGWYISAGGNCFNVFPARDVLFVADGDGGIKLLDISDPTSPEVMFDEPTDVSIKDVFYLDEYLYAVGGDRLLVYYTDVVDTSAGTPDTTPPMAGFIYPDPYAVTSCRDQNIFLIARDNTEVDYSSIVLRLNSVNYTVDSSGLSVVGDTIRFEPPDDFYSHNDTILVLLTSLSDTAGNSVEGLPLELVFYTDFEPPEFYNPMPEPSSVILDTMIAVSVNIEDIPAGVNPTSLSMSVNGEILSYGDFTWDGERISYECSFSPGDSVEVCLLRAGDNARYCGSNMFAGTPYCWSFSIYEPPAIEARFISPTDGASLSWAHPDCKLFLHSEDGIDPMSIMFETEEDTYTIDSPELDFANDTLYFDAPFETEHGREYNYSLLSAESISGAILETAVSITFFGDIEPPDVISTIPENGETIHTVTPEIAFEIVDEPAGVNPYVLRINVDGTAYRYPAGVDWDGEYATVTAPVEFSDPDTVEVCLASCGDRVAFGSPNMLVPPYCFTFYVSVSGIEEDYPSGFSLLAYPVPFNSSVEIQLNLERSVDGNLCIFNQKGQLLKVLQEGVITSGRYIWNARGFPSGVYFCQLTSDKYNDCVKIILLK